MVFFFLRKKPPSTSLTERASSRLAKAAGAKKKRYIIRRWELSKEFAQTPDGNELFLEKNRFENLVRECLKGRPKNEKVSPKHAKLDYFRWFSSLKDAREKQLAVEIRYLTVFVGYALSEKMAGNGVDTPTIEIIKTELAYAAKEYAKVCLAKTVEGLFPAFEGISPE